MAFAAGAFSLISGNPVVTSTTISSTWANNTLDDIADNGLSLCVLKDGSQTITADITLSGFKLTNLANATAVADAPRVSQIQNQSFTYLTSVAGTNTVTGTATPTPAAYAAGQSFEFVPAVTNTGATTLNVSSLGAKNIYFKGAACVGGELVANVPVRVTYDGTQFNVIGAAGVIKGTTTNDAAAGGFVGEFISSTIASGSAVSLTSATPANVTSISLTAGDWDVFGTIGFNISSGATMGFAIGGSTSSSASTPAHPYRSVLYPPSGATITPETSFTVQRVSISGTTTIYLVANANFTGGTVSAYGHIGARRAR